MYRISLMKFKIFLTLESIVTLYRHVGILKRLSTIITEDLFVTSLCVVCYFKAMQYLSLITLLLNVLH